MREAQKCVAAYLLFINSAYNYMHTYSTRTQNSVLGVAAARRLHGLRLLRGSRHVRVLLRLRPLHDRPSGECGPGSGLVSNKLLLV